MAFVHRAVPLRWLLKPAMGRTLSRSVTSRARFPSVKGAWNKTTTATFCMAGLAGTLYLITDEKTKRDLVQSVKSLLIVTAANSDTKGKKPCNLKIGAPCNKKKEKADDCLESQPNITSPLKTYSLFLWITLEPTADPCAVGNAAVRIDEAIKAAENPCGCNEEIIAGVGFGPNFLAQSLGPACKNYCYRHRKGKNGELPVTDGDIFVHAKCDNLGQLFDFCKHYMHCFPEDSILEFEDVYG